MTNGWARAHDYPKRRKYGAMNLGRRAITLLTAAALLLMVAVRGPAGPHRRGPAHSLRPPPRPSTPGRSVAGAGPPITTIGPGAGERAAHPSRTCNGRGRRR